MSTISFEKLITDFRSRKFLNEDDIKIAFAACIVSPILKAVNPNKISEYSSETTCLAGGRADATFQNISFELKKYNHFSTNRGIEEALYGRNNRDHGLYDYLISNSNVVQWDSKSSQCKKLFSQVGVGFDGKKFIFCRFCPGREEVHLKTQKLKLNFQIDLAVDFIYEIKDFETGIRILCLLLKQQNKIELNKKGLLSRIHKKSDFVRSSIKKIYDEISNSVHDSSYKGRSDRSVTLYEEWNRVFGVVYGNADQQTDFTKYVDAIKEDYGIAQDNLDYKIYLFSLQTFFNIFLKILIYNFLSTIIDPAFAIKKQMSRHEIISLFEGCHLNNSPVDNFFEIHFLEWFTYSSLKIEDIVNDVCKVVDEFDLTTFALKPENIQDILEEIYMELIPRKLRHLMGEYFSPDWIVAHALDVAGYDGNIDKRIIDPCCGSGPFITQALKRVLRNNDVTEEKLHIITQNIVGFDINPISVVAAKANYILTLFSAYFSKNSNLPSQQVTIPIFIADSVMAPIVYTEQNHNTLKLDTCVGPLILPKFNSYDSGKNFLRYLSSNISDLPKPFPPFFAYCLSKSWVKEEDRGTIEKLYMQLFELHRRGKDSFWGSIMCNSYAPIMLGKKFDFVVGNPPWIAWKGMSKTYRERSLEIWKSYGIFECNAYDKKTTHDDFGMAVVYVAVDQYLENGGTMVFLLPASFLKASKGGYGFRKFSITRNRQNTPFCIEQVDDFSDVKLFTISTDVVKFKKGKRMTYPMNNYRVMHQIEPKKEFDPHSTWEEVAQKLTSSVFYATPVSNDAQSSWLTMSRSVYSRALKILNSNNTSYYTGRKGVEPCGAKGVFILLHPKKLPNGNLSIVNDMKRQRRTDFLAKGQHPGEVEEEFVYPMLGGRNIEKWRVKSCEFMLVPHDSNNPYGIPAATLAAKASHTYEWLNFYYEELLASRIQNGKFFNKDIHPFYRLDNVGAYTFAPYKVLWKEQSGVMSAVVVHSYLQDAPCADRHLFSEDKCFVVDSKVLMLGLNNKDEAYYVCGILNSHPVTEVIDAYAIPTNRGIDVLKNIRIVRFSRNTTIHMEISSISEKIHSLAKQGVDFTAQERILEELVKQLYGI